MQKAKKRLRITGSGGTALEVSDFGRSVAFYRDTLGLDVKIYADDHFAMIPSVNLALLGVEGKVASKGFHIELDVTDVDAWYEHIKAKGVKPLSRPRNQPWGERVFYVADPDGHEIEFQGEGL